MVHVVSEILFGRAIRYAVVIGEVEVGDPQIEGRANNLPLHTDGVVITEVMPQTQ